MNTPPLHPLSSPTAASSSEISCEEDDTPSCQLNCRHSQQLNQISPTRVSHSADEKRDEPRPETTREHLVKSKSERILDEKLEYAKILLGIAFPMLLSLLVATSEIAKTSGARIAVIALSFALAYTVSCLLLRKTYPKISTASLICGAILTMFSVFSLLFTFLPSNLKMILVLCGVVLLIALVLLGWEYVRRENKMKDPEEGELIYPARISCSDWKENNTRKNYRKAEQELMEQRRKRPEKEEERMMNESLANPGGVRVLGPKH